MERDRPALVKYIRAGVLTFTAGMPSLAGFLFFLGIAFAAQLEAARVGLPEPAEPDRWAPGTGVPAQRPPGVQADRSG